MLALLLSNPPFLRCLGVKGGSMLKAVKSKISYHFVKIITFIVSLGGCFIGRCSNTPLKTKINKVLMIIEKTKKKIT